MSTPFVFPSCQWQHTSSVKADQECLWWAVEDPDMGGERLGHQKESFVVPSVTSVETQKEGGGRLSSGAP